MFKQSSTSQKKIANLYAEDFEKVPDKKIVEIEEPCVPFLSKEKDIISKDILEKYYNDGFQEGIKREREKNNLEEEHISSIKNIFHSIEMKISDQKTQISQEILFVIISSMKNLFPNLLEKYGPDDSIILFQKLYPFLNKNSHIKLSCSKEFFSKVKKILQEYSNEEIIFDVDETLKNGDFKVFWDTGSLSRDTNEFMEAIFFQIMASNRGKEDKNVG